MKFEIIPPLLREDSILLSEDRENLRNMYEKLGNKTWERAAGDDELDPERLRRSHITYNELLEQSKMIRETVTEEKEHIAAVAALLSQKGVNRIAMIGCGDSIAAERGTKHFLEALLQIPCDVYEAYDIAYYDSGTFDAHTLLIALSASGETVSVVEAMLVAKARGALTLALSNTPGSSLMSYATVGMKIHARRQGWPTQSSTSAMAMLIQFGLELARCNGVAKETVDRFEAEFQQIPARMDAAIEMCEPWAIRNAAEIADQPVILFAGGGPYYTCAEYGAAKVKECTPARAIATPLEEYHHYNTQKTGDHLYVIAPSGMTTRRALDTIYTCKSCDGVVHVVTNETEQELMENADDYVLVPACSEYFANFVCSIPMQLLGYYLSCERERRAREMLET